MVLGLLGVLTDQRCIACLGELCVPKLVSFNRWGTVEFAEVCPPFKHRVSASPADTDSVGRQSLREAVPDLWSSSTRMSTVNFTIMTDSWSCTLLLCVGGCWGGGQDRKISLWIVLALLQWRCSGMRDWWHQKQVLPAVPAPPTPHPPPLSGSFVGLVWLFFHLCSSISVLLTLPHDVLLVEFPRLSYKWTVVIIVVRCICPIVLLLYRPDLSVQLSLWAGVTTPGDLSRILLYRLVYLLHRTSVMPTCPAGAALDVCRSYQAGGPVLYLLYRLVVLSQPTFLERTAVVSVCRSNTNGTSPAMYCTVCCICPFAPLVCCKQMPHGGVVGSGDLSCIVLHNSLLY